MHLIPRETCIVVVPTIVDPRGSSLLRQRLVASSEIKP
jgi:hypothetical protein